MPPSVRHVALPALWVLFASALFAAQAGLVTAAPARAPAGPRFAIRRFVVEGNTLIPPQDVEAILAQFRGESLSLRVDWAYVTNGTGERASGSNRLHFVLAYGF